jgi:hypothetical protein
MMDFPLPLFTTTQGIKTSLKSQVFIHDIQGVQKTQDKKSKKNNNEQNEWVYHGGKDK